MNNYMPKSFDEILINPKDKSSILKFFINLIKFNNDPILSKELESYCRKWQEVDVLNLKNICVILGAPGSGKTTLIKYLCDKLNIRECYYESESQEHINFIRNMNEEEENNHYYHPYNNFMLYYNCQIGNTKKPKILLEKKKEQERKKIDNLSLTGTSRKIKSSINESLYSNKILKISSGTNNRNTKISESVLIDNLKKKILEDSIEINNINGRITNGFFKIHDFLIYILKNLIKANILKEKKNHCLFVSNSFNRIINKNSVVAEKIMKKINSVLVLAHNLSEEIIKNSIEANKIKKKTIIDLFVDSNFSEYIINDLNESINLNEEINVDLNESNHLNKKIIDNLNLYNNLKEEINDDLILVNTLKEELNDLIESKNLKKKIEDLLIINESLKDQKKNELRLKEINDYVIINFLDEENNNNVSNKLNTEIKYFIEPNKSKEIIRELTAANNLKHRINECLIITNKLNERINDINLRESKEIKERLHNIILGNDINKKINDSMVEENYQGKLIDLIASNNFNEYLINDLNISNTVKELIIDNMFLSNYLKDIFIINSIVINHLKEEIINDLIVSNNSKERIEENLNIYNSPIKKENYSIVGSNLNGKVYSSFTGTNDLYKEIKFFVENNNSNKKTNGYFMYDNNLSAERSDSIKINNSKEKLNDNLDLSEKLFKKLINYSYEIYKLNKKIINNLNKTNNIFEEVIAYLNKNDVLKVKLLYKFIEVIDIRDKIIDSFSTNNSKEKMNFLILKNSLYKKLMDIDLKKKREEEKKKLYYEENYIVTRAVIIDEIPVTELEHSEEFRESCVASMRFVFNRVDYCKQEYLKYSKEKNNSKYLECYAIHPIIIFINSYEQIKTVNTLLGIDINYSPYVDFIKLKKIHPLYLEKILTEKYYHKMIKSNKEMKEIIKHYSHNCNGDIRSCFNALDFLNRIPELHKMSLEDINSVSTICQGDIFGFVKKVLYRNIGSNIISISDLHSPNNINFDFSFSDISAYKCEDNSTEDIINKNICTASSRIILNESTNKINNTSNHHVLETKNKMKNINSLNISKRKLFDNNSINNRKPTDDIHKKKSVYRNIFEELDNNADMMSISQKFQILSLLKENYLFFYNSLSDIGLLISNLSIIDYSFCGIDCSNLLMRKSYDNLSGDILRFINDHFRLTYRYYIICNTNPRVPIGNPSVPPDSEEKYTLDVIKKKKLEYSMQNPDMLKMDFTLKTNPMNKYYHHFSIVRKELYDRYIMIVIKKLINQNENNIEDIASKYSFFLRGNHELFSSFFPCYILLIIEHWNKQYEKEYNDINQEKKYILSLNKNMSELNQNSGFYFNKCSEICYDFKSNLDENRKRSEHLYNVISFVETFITPKFIAIFFPSYLKYLKNGTKQKRNVRNLIGNQAVSTETYFEMRNLLRLHDIELYNYFFHY